MDPMSAAELLKLLDTVLDAAKKAESDSPADRDRAVDGLKSLAKANVTTAVLGETQAGKRVRSLTKHSDAAIADAATKAVAAWKNVVRRESGAAAPSSAAPSGSAPSAAAETDAAGAGGASASMRRADSTATAATVSTAAGVAPADIPSTGDTVRDKVRSNLVAALHKAVTEGAESEFSVVDLAVSIEEALLSAHSGVTPAYKTKFRQLHFNLKDEKNPDLRRRVVEGVISPDALLTLSPEELASDAKREENEKIREKKLFDSAPSSVKQATTDQFQCGKCKQRKCTYYQMQTRSADEPMTTFVRCTVCSNSWKFC